MALGSAKQKVGDGDRWAIIETMNLCAMSLGGEYLRVEALLTAAMMDKLGGAWERSTRTRATPRQYEKNIPRSGYMVILSVIYCILYQFGTLILFWQYLDPRRKS